MNTIKRWQFRKQLKLNTRLLIVFFSAIFLLSVVNLFVYGQLFATMVREEQTLNEERISSASEKLDMAIRSVKQSYVDLIAGEENYIFSQTQPSAWSFVLLHKKAASILESNPYIAHWMILFPLSDKTIGSSGYMGKSYYFERFCKSEEYSPFFWNTLAMSNPANRYYPGTDFQILDASGRYQTRYLVPFVTKTYNKIPVTTVILLDVEAITKDCDPYLAQNFYIFQPDGSLLCSTDASPVITVPPEETAFTAHNGISYAVQQYTNPDGLRYIKLLPQNEAFGILQGSLVLSISALVISVVASVLLVLSAVKRATHPVDGMMKLLQEHSSLENVNDLYGAHSELEQILRSREEQAAKLAQREATLSQYFLQSRLKNVYVDMSQPEDREERTSYILYIQIQYKETMRSFFSMTRAELENCLQEMLSGALNRLFDTTLIFQLEPGRFAAKVTLPHPETQMGDRMERFLRRLEIEQEYAGFTVVQSQPLGKYEDLSAVYSQMQEASRQAVVGNNLQLLTLPLKKKSSPAFAFSREDSQALHEHIHQGNMEEASALAARILQENLRRGVSHAQMAVLCISIVNATAYAMTEQTPGAEKIAAASGVYHTLTTRCVTIWDYIDTVTGFIRSASATGEVREAEDTTDDGLLGRIQHYLRKNYQNDLSGEQIAEALWVSRSYLSSYYKSKTGMNLSDSIQLFRIQKATELLKDPNIKIGDVGPLVGIPSQNTFLRQFKKYTGMTPKEYRQKELG